MTKEKEVPSIDALNLVPACIVSVSVLVVTITFIEATDWDVVGKKFVAAKSEWIDLDEYEQAIYKAKFFGLDKIDIDYQTEHYLNKPYLFSYLKVID